MPQSFAAGLTDKIIDVARNVYKTAKTLHMTSDINCWEPSYPSAVQIPPSTLRI